MDRAYRFNRLIGFLDLHCYIILQTTLFRGRQQISGQSFSVTIPLVHTPGYIHCAIGHAIENSVTFRVGVGGCSSPTKNNFKWPGDCIDNCFFFISFLPFFRPFDLCSCYQLRQSSRGTGIMSKGSNIPLTFNNPTTTGFYLLPQTPHSYWSLETFDFSGLIHGRWGVGWVNWKLIVRRRRRRGDILNYGPTWAGVSFFGLFRPVKLLKWNGNRKQICRNPNPLAGDVTSAVLCCWALKLMAYQGSTPGAYTLHGQKNSNEKTAARRRSTTTMVSAIDYLFSSCVDMYGISEVIKVDHKYLTPKGFLPRPHHGRTPW